MLEKIKNSSFVKNIALLASGSMIANIITVCCSPIITRIYSAQEIGIYSYLIAMVNTFTAILNLRYDMAIVSGEKEDVYPIIKLCILLGAAFSLIATILFGVYFIFFKTEYESYRYIIIFFFLILLANSLINVFNSYNNRTKEYGVMTSVHIIRTSLQNIGGIALGIFKLGVFALILPYTLGQFFGMRRQSATLKPKFSEMWASDVNSMKRVAKKYWKLPVYSAPALLANSFSYSSVTIFIESLFDMSTVGYYSLSTRILGLPLSLISGNVSKVFFQEASCEQEKNGHYKSSFKKTVSLLITLSIPMGIIMYMFAPWACRFFLGSSWSIAGQYIRILTPYYMCRFVGTAISPALIVCQKQKQELWIQLSLVATSVISGVITIMASRTIEMFLVCICITKSIIYIMLILLSWKYSKGTK